MTRPITTVLPVGTARQVPPPAFVELARYVEASGHVDCIWNYDQLVSFLPKCLWTEENTPLAATGDIDSMHDASILTALQLAATENVGGHLGGLDAIRRGPAELMQTLLTLQSLTQHELALLLAVGEVKQCKPFGHKRSQGLTRYEDMVQLLHLLFDNEYTTFEGNHWKLENAFLGEHRPDRRPLVFGLGGGPKFLDLSAKYADGIVTGALSVFGGAEGYAEMVEEVRKKVEQYGRDPDAFRFGHMMSFVLHDDPEIQQKAVDNKIIRHFAATIGRLDMKLWYDEGLTPAWPDDWHYALHYVPFTVTEQEAAELDASVSEEMVRKSFPVGTPSECADAYAPYIEAGADTVYMFDVTATVLSPEEGMQSIDNQIEVCRLIKERYGSA